MYDPRYPCHPWLLIPSWSSSVASVSPWFSPTHRPQKIFQNFFAAASAPDPPKPKMRLKSCIVPQHLFNFATPKKDGRTWVPPCRLVPRFALDVRKSPSLRVSVGGGQISLTSVLIGDFVHVLLCLFT